MPICHIIGGGIAGLSAATALAASGAKPVLYEAAPMLGGRCRSFESAQMEAVIDNGSHLILGANRHALRYVRRIGAERKFRRVAPGQIPFMHIKSSRSWTLRLGGWLGVRGLPEGAGGRLSALLRLMLAGRHSTVEDAIPRLHPLHETLIAPLCLAALNTKPEEASARQLWRVLRALLTSTDAGDLWLARHSLSDALIDPAARVIAEEGGQILLHHRLQAVETDGARVTGLAFGEREVEVAASDTVILALPAWEAAHLLPHLHALPDGFRAIFNLHFRCPPVLLRFLSGMPLCGLLGGASQWLFARGDILSVTISAAEAWQELSARELSAMVWEEVCGAFGVDLPEPESLIIKEKRATFAATPANLAARPDPRTPLANLWLAGDYVRSPLPATIDAAARSGEEAAALALRHLHAQPERRRHVLRYGKKALTRLREL